MVRDKIKEERTIIEHINKEVMIVDHLTKGLTSKLFHEQVIRTNVLNNFDVLG